MSKFVYDERMARIQEIAPGEVYHVYSRGVERRTIFLDDADRVRFLDLLRHSLPAKPRPSLTTVRRMRRSGLTPWESPAAPPGQLVAVFSYCPMPNHLHLLAREQTAGGLSKYLQRVLIGYARYFNSRHQHVGPLFAGRFHAVHITTDEQLLHTSRYIHLNPYVAGLVKDPLAYPWGSGPEYFDSPRPRTICDTTLIHGMLTPAEHQKFILDHADYARSLARELKEVHIDAEVRTPHIITHSRNE